MVAGVLSGVRWGGSWVPGIPHTATHKSSQLMRGPLGSRREVIRMNRSVRLQLDEATTETVEMTDLANDQVKLETTPLSGAQPL